MRFTNSVKINKYKLHDRLQFIMKKDNNSYKAHLILSYMYLAQIIGMSICTKLFIFHLDKRKQHFFFEWHYLIIIEYFQQPCHKVNALQTTNVLQHWLKKRSPQWYCLSLVKIMHNRWTCIYDTNMHEKPSSLHRINTDAISVLTKGKHTGFNWSHAKCKKKLNSQFGLSDLINMGQKLLNNSPEC